jgi:hypothetical protein
VLAERGPDLFLAKEAMPLVFDIDEAAANAARTVIFQ